VKASSNAAALARKYAQRIAALNKALERGLGKSAKSVDGEQIKRLSGPPIVGNYPVPVHSKKAGGKKTGGHLRGSSGWAVQGHKQAAVFNTAEYAFVIHDGRGSSEKYGPRPFLDDAVKAVDVSGIVAGEVRKAFAI
jgi:hypothetical protein